MLIAGRVGMAKNYRNRYIGVFRTIAPHSTLATNTQIKTLLLTCQPFRGSQLGAVFVPQCDQNTNFYFLTKTATANAALTRHSFAQEHSTALPTFCYPNTLTLSVFRKSIEMNIYGHIRLVFYFIIPKF